METQATLKNPIKKFPPLDGKSQYTFKIVDFNVRHPVTIEINLPNQRAIKDQFDILPVYRF